jgi:hypothetical protein
MEEIRTSETSVCFNMTNRHYMPEICHIQCVDGLESPSSELELVGAHVSNLGFHKEQRISRRAPYLKECAPRSLLVGIKRVIKKKVKQSRYTPWRRLGGEEV